MRIRSIHRDEYGGALLEVAILIPFLFVFVLGTVDFMLALNDWSQAAKAAEVGARLAAVSNPVATNLADPTVGITQKILTVTGSTVQPGDPMPSFTVTCSGNNTTCSCSAPASSTCWGYGSSVTLDATALKTIVYGRGNSGSCNNPTSFYFVGMCNMYPGLVPANVVVTYNGTGPNGTGLGYAGRPDGPVPTVQVSVRGLTFNYFFLQQLMNLGSLTIPPTASAPVPTTGEALSSSRQCFYGPC